MVSGDVQASQISGIVWIVSRKSRGAGTQGSSRKGSRVARLHRSSISRKVYHRVISNFVYPVPQPYCLEVESHKRL